MRPYTLKRDILYYCIQGKLVPQDASEGTGYACIETNNKRRESFPADIKKRVGKGCKQIAESELLFDVPESWTWERFGNLVINYDSQRKPVAKSERKTLEGQYDYYGATGSIDRVDEYIFEGEYLMIGEDGGNFFVDRDNSFIARGKFWANNHVHVVQPIVCNIDYLKICLDSYDLPNMGLINGIAVPKLNQENMNSILIPVPPIAEQKRIVEKLEELLPLVDQYEQAWSKLKDFNARFPMDMQKSILQMAIQGKLVPQDASEGTGKELYQKIQAEKAKLIKEGKIKKQKALTEITEDEIPFDIPNSWRWMRVGDVGSWSAGATPSRTKPDYYGGSIPWLKTGDLNDNYIIEVPEFITDKALQETSVRLNPVGSVLMAMYGATIGKLGINKIPLTTNQACCACIPYGGIYNRYLFFFLMAQRSFYIKLGEGGAQPNISKEKIIASVFPLPPLAEQKRIVERIEELLPYYERLKELY